MKNKSPKYKEINYAKDRGVRFYAIKVSVKGSDADYYVNTSDIFLSNSVCSSVLFDDYIIAKITLEKYLRTLDKDHNISKVSLVELTGSFSTIEKFKQSL